MSRQEESPRTLPIRTRSYSAPSGNPRAPAPPSEPSSTVPVAVPASFTSTTPFIYPSLPNLEHDGFPATSAWMAKSDVDAYITALRRKIESGSARAETYQRQLDRPLELRETSLKRTPKPPKTVYKRIQSLKSFLSSQSALIPEDSPFRINAKAVLEKYCSGELQVEPGMVTYWAYGRQLCGPKPKDEGDMLEAAKENGGERGWFWVEDPRESVQQ
ncbi:hypothetical protein VTN00DRAFT_3761 [Thermoascus crustaceus]|uniref:uncharacterized protein n=1 Tax=Thermoascus crustaceus TaxID=5088 RepID=UPI0037436CB5